jgi:signal transduction histidine kinase
MSAWTTAAAVDVKSQLFRALAVLRVILLVNAVALNLYRIDNFTSHAAAFACIAAMVVWTAVALWAYAEPRRRGRTLLVADLLVTTALLAITPVVKGAEFNASVPGYWTMGALFAWAIHYRRAGGLAAGILLAGVDLVVRPEITQTDYGNAFLLVIGGLVVGYMCESLQRMAVERELAERTAAAAAERTRLARVVHDGVLQVLALVQRRGNELGQDGPELARLAGEQERELRALIREEAAAGPLAAGGNGRTLDLVVELGRLERDHTVTVATPATSVDVPETTARELVAVVRACLDNVALHVGEGAPAWVLLQSFPDHVEVSVRDEGPGIADGRLEEAAGQGRLGVSQSIRGRVADLGGTTILDTGPWGTEWEFVVPLR